MLRTLKGRLAVFLMVAVAVTSTVAALIQKAIHDQRLVEETVERHELLTDQTLEIIHQAMRHGSPEQVGAILEAAGRYHGLAGLRVVDERGRIHFSNQRAEVGTRLEHFDAKGLRPGRPTVAMALDDGRTLATVTEVIPNEVRCASCHNGSRPPGIFEVRLDVSRDAAKHSAGWWSLLMGLAIAQVVLFFFLWELSKGLVVEPVRRLVLAMRRVAARGDLTERVEASGPAEFESLVGAYNGMLDELHEARQKLDAYYQDNLARADRLATVGEMATAMAHEIQNPLAGLSGALRIIGRDPAMAERKEIVDEMLATLQRLSNTTSDLLSYARPTEPRFEVVDVQQVAQNVLMLLRQQHHAQPVTLEAELDEDVPPAWTDPQQLRQVLLNVCLNAIQAIAPEPGRVRVRVRALDEDTRIRIEVVDDGPGIDADALESVFRPFFTTKPRGTGLGLAITRRIVERSGGCIRILSTVGEGTTVRIDLPTHGGHDLAPVPCDGREEPTRLAGGSA